MVFALPKLLVVYKVVSSDTISREINEKNDLKGVGLTTNGTQSWLGEAGQTASSLSKSVKKSISMEEGVGKGGLKAPGRVGMDPSEREKLRPGDREKGVEIDRGLDKL